MGIIVIARLGLLGMGFASFVQVDRKLILQLDFVYV
jgi:hypothetical protein